MAELIKTTSHVVHPRLPVWVINLALILLIAALWPVGWAMDQYMDSYVKRVIILIGLNVMLATSLNLVNGITGQFSLGHAGFIAVGAYVTGSAMKYFAATPERGALQAEPFGPVTGQFVLLGLLVAGGIAAALAGLIVGIPALRLKGDYLAIATLGFGEIIYTIIINTNQIGPFEVGGATGLHTIPVMANFFWIYAAMVVCVVTVWRLAYSTKGLAFRAVREDEVAAAAMGLDTTYYKVLAFAIGAFFAGIAGGLFATLEGDLAPASFRFMRSIEFVVMVVLGGAGSITGVILAAIILTYLPEQLRFSSEWRMVIYSLLLIGMMLLRPEGLLGSREVWFRRRSRKGFDPINVPPAPSSGGPPAA